MFLHQSLNNILLPDRIFFKTQEDIIVYQNRRIKEIEKIFPKKFDYTSYHIKPDKLENSKKILTLYTSGSSNGVRTAYLYDRPMYKLIENYHWHRILHFNQLKAGTVIRFKLARTTDSLNIEGPYQEWATGIKNNVYYVPFNNKTCSANYWKETFFKIIKLNPSIIYCTPSLYESFADYLEFSFNCPVLFSQEILYPEIRNKAMTHFNRVIDKMRCWDGGLSFFECRYGTKHINDELSKVECINGKIYSSDFFNFAQPFFKYWNGDMGKITLNQCSCGIFGNIFTEFEGKHIQCLTDREGNKIPGAMILSNIYSILQRIEKKDFLFQVKQTKDHVFLIFNQPINNHDYKRLKEIITKNLKLDVIFQYNPKLFENNFKRLLTVSDL